MEKGLSRRRRLRSGLAVLALASLAAARPPAPAADPPLLRPGSPLHQPPQRGLDEIAALPTRQAACPACSRSVAIPEANRLLRPPEGKWEMDASAGRDADLCPHPGPFRLSFQADRVICPDCGFAGEADAFGQPAPPEISAWAAAALRPGLRALQARLLGPRAAALPEEDLIALFNRQEEIPDAIRLEHARICGEALGIGGLRLAEAAWLAAWAIRRELCAPPRGEALRQLAENVEKTRLAAPAAAGAEGIEAEAEAFRRLIERAGRGKGVPPAPERLAARLLLAGRLDRLGLGREAEEELEGARAAFAERFARPEQDPFWPLTNSRSRSSVRAEELESLRREAEREAASRLALLLRERAYLEEAADRLRQGLRAGEGETDREATLFHSYLIGEFLRRAEKLPLAAEWLGTLAGLVPEASPLGRATDRQLRRLRAQAEGRVNLLAALGEDGDLLAKIRETALPAKGRP